MTVRYRLQLTSGDDPDVIAARLWAAGALGLQELPGELVAWFDTRLDSVPPGGDWEQQPDEDWLAAWREGIEPVRAGRVVVVPTWLAEDHVARPGDVVVVLDPGVAFGPGHHATTRQCLDVLQEVLRPGQRVLDVGCGTGVLAIAAALLGAAEVTGVDVDADAVRTTRANARDNRVAVAADLGGGEVVTEPADVVLANIITPTLLEIVEELVGCVRPGGLGVLSGVSSDRAAEVAAVYAAAGAAPVRRTDEDGWAMLLHRTEEPGP
jgi:ribosomal protein L11 methyltransferase